MLAAPLNRNRCQAGRQGVAAWSACVLGHLPLADTCNDAIAVAEFGASCIGALRSDTSLPLHSFCVQEEFQFYMEDAQSKLLVVVSRLPCLLAAVGCSLQHLGSLLVGP